MIAPGLGRPGPALSWLDGTMLLALGGIWLAAFVRLLEGRPLVPQNDPSLNAS
jgi:hypothetical protein